MTRCLLGSSERNGEESGGLLSFQNGRSMKGSIPDYELKILFSVGNLGWPGRPLATPDPTSYDLLPMDDEALNSGVC